MAFTVGLHATACKFSQRKVLFSSVQEQSQHQQKDNFLEEHINVSNLFEINETQVKILTCDSSVGRAEDCSSLGHWF